MAKSISDSGGRALFVAGDAAVEADVGATIALGVETFGAINVLVNNVARTSKATLIGVNEQRRQVTANRSALGLRGVTR